MRPKGKKRPLKSHFAHPLAYHRNRGYRTAALSLPFTVLKEFSDSEPKVVPLVGTKLLSELVCQSPENPLFTARFAAICLSASANVCHYPRRNVGPSVGLTIMGKLTDRAARTVGVGRHGDGDGLFLVVSAAGSRKWVLRYQLNGKRRDMGLGSYPDVGLAAARASALRARGLIAQGVDPLAERAEAKKAARPVPTFGEIAAIVVGEAQAKTTNAKVAYQWARHLGADYCDLLLGRPVNEITTLDVAAVLRPVWRKKPEVARKLYPAIRRVFEYARIRLRDDNGIIFDNPGPLGRFESDGLRSAGAIELGAVIRPCLMSKCRRSCRRYAGGTPSRRGCWNF